MAAVECPSLEVQNPHGCGTSGCAGTQPKVGLNLGDFSHFNDSGFFPTLPRCAAGSIPTSSVALPAPLEVLSPSWNIRAALTSFYITKLQVFRNFYSTFHLQLPNSCVKTQLCLLFPSTGEFHKAPQSSIKS